MCGIVGIYAPGGPPPHRALWPAIVNLLRHRGPDEGGWWADGPFFLGHRRLSIIGVDTGQQPMCDESGRLVVTFNGEIYNYRELRSTLEGTGRVFKTETDTEVLLHGYAEWGEALPSKLRGMFAFAIADRVRGELFAARDRFGEKPFLYARTGAYFAFASELKALAALPDLPQEIDLDGLGGYLCLNYVPGTRTLLTSVRRLAPGGWLRASPTGVVFGTYWQPSTDEAGAAGPTSLEEAYEAWRPLFDQAVKRALLSDVPVGILLSGGIDSSLVAESAVRQGHLNAAYLLDFEDASYSEYDGASEVASRLGLPLERVVLGSDAMEHFLDLVHHGDDPLADSSALPVWLVSRLAARRNKVVLGGDGGDELFGGYLTYQATRLHGRWVAPLPPPVRRALAWASRHLPVSEGKVTTSYRLWRFLRASDLPGRVAHLTWNGTWLPDEAAGLVANHEAARACQRSLDMMAGGYGLARRPSLRDLQRLDLAEYLPNDILTKMDRFSMANSLETRAPFLDADLAEWALRAPDELKVGRDGSLKVLLRYAAHRVLGPRVARRPKKGFSIPVHQWIRRGALAERVRELLSPPALSRMPFLDAARVGSVLDAHFAGRKAYGWEIWGLAVLSAWHASRIDRRPDLPSPDGVTEHRFRVSGLA